MLDKMKQANKDTIRHLISSVIDREPLQCWLNMQDTWGQNPSSFKLYNEEVVT